MVEIGKVLSNAAVAKDIWAMEIHAPEIAKAAAPGQFVNVRLTEKLDPLLRRPISLNSIDAQTGAITLLYLVVGEGTEMMTRLTPGDSIDVLGPLGRGFTLDFAGENAILVGGGIGVAPLYPLAQALRAKGKAVTLIAGAKNEGYLADLDRYTALGATVCTATDDGSAGVHGFVTDVLRDRIADGTCDYIYACGPLPILRAVDDMARENGIDGEVSAESHMGCGLGVCLLCANKRKAGGYALTCTDGPVFKMGELAYEEC